MVFVESMNDNLLSSFAGSTSSKTKITTSKKLFFYFENQNPLLVLAGKSLYFASCIDGKSLGLNELCRLKAPNDA